MGNVIFGRKKYFAMKEGVRLGNGHYDAGEFLNLWLRNPGDYVVVTNNRGRVLAEFWT